MAGDLEGITVEFRASTVQFDNGVKGINSALKNLRSEVSTMNKELKLDPGSVDTYTAKLKNFQQQVQLNTTKLEDLRNQQLELGNTDLDLQKWQILQNDINKTEANITILNRSIDSTKQTISRLEP